MSLLWIAAAIVVGALVAIPYGLIPTLLYHTHRAPAESTLGPMSPEDVASLDEATFAAIDAKVAELRALGFRRPTAFRTVEGPTTIVGALLEHPEHGDLASFVVGRSPNAPAKAFPVFESEWEDGYRVVTTNTTQTPIFPRARDVDGMSLPRVRLLADLYQVHRARVERTSRAARRIHLTRGDDALAEERARLARDRRRHVETGYLRRVGDLVQPTLHGAFLMTWRTLPPWSSLVTLERDLREAELLRELGLG